MALKDWKQNQNTIGIKVWNKKRKTIVYSSENNQGVTIYRNRKRIAKDSKQFGMNNKTKALAYARAYMRKH